MRGTRHVSALAVALVAAALGSAAPPVDVPAEVKGEPGDFITIRAKTPGKVVFFVPLDPGLKAFPADLLNDKKAAVYTAAKPGRYRVLAYSSVKDEPTEPATVTVVIGDAPPVPPGPSPPDPPNPPLSPLAKVLSEAFARDTAADRRERLSALADVMAEAARISLSADHADTAALTAEVTRLRTKAVGDGLPNTRSAIGDHLNAKFGKAPFPLTQESRPKVMAAYADVAAALREVLK